MSVFVQALWQRITRRNQPASRDAQQAIAPSSPSTIIPGIEIALDDPLFSYCLTIPGVLEIDSLNMQSAALQAIKTAGIKFILPLVSQGELVGLLSLGARLSDQEYAPSDFQLLNNLAIQAASALRIAQLAHHQQVEARQIERFEQQMRIAGIIQQTLLPKQIPVLLGWQLAAYWQPAQTVGGDFYDFLVLPNGHVVLIIGDVTDKGVPAALLMASTRSVLRAAAERLNSPGEVLKRTNDVLCPDMPPKMFVTCLCAVLDPVTGQLRYANAGHNPPYQRTADGVVELRARGMPLGLMPNMNYEEQEATLALGDSVLFYSDGLVEAHDPARQMFGEPRLRTLVADHPGGQMLIDFLRAELHRFTGPTWEQEDDVTLVTLQRSPQNQPTPPSSNVQHQLAEFTIPSQPGNERLALDRLVEVIRDVNLPMLRLERLKTAVAETTMNAMEHGNHYRADAPVVITVQASKELLSVRVTDQGGDRPIPQAETPDLEAKLAGLQSPRGWGLFLVKNMVDDMLISSDSAHHTVELIMKLGGTNNGNS